MKNAVIISDAAAADITEQFHYIRLNQQQPMNAERWLRGVYAAVDGLEDFAGHGRALESDFLGIELRQKTFKSHRIVYFLDEQKHEVVVHYLRHGARRAVGEAPADE